MRESAKFFLATQHMHLGMHEEALAKFKVSVMFRSVRYYLVKVDSTKRKVNLGSFNTTDFFSALLTTLSLGGKICLRVLLLCRDLQEVGTGGASGQAHAPSRLTGSLKARP